MRLASWPTMAATSAAGQCTTDGVSRRPSASAMTSGMPESTVATSELVVPRSMPTILLIVGSERHILRPHLQALIMVFPDDGRIEFERFWRKPPAGLGEGLLGFFAGV